MCVYVLIDGVLFDILLDDEKVLWFVFVVVLLFDDVDDEVRIVGLLLFEW